MRTRTAALINSMTLAELQTEIDCVMRDISDIKMQIDFAKAKQKQTGAYADPDWYARANTALRIRGREHQMLMVAAGKKRKAENIAKTSAPLSEDVLLERAQAKANRAASFDACFVEAAKESLPAEMFDQLASIAKQRVKRGK